MIDANHRFRYVGDWFIVDVGFAQERVMKQHYKQQIGSLEMVEKQYNVARKAYARLGVDTDAAIRQAMAVPISVHCWQADDVAGLESKEGVTDSGGIMATGSYPGRARNGEEMRQDLGEVIKLLPGNARVNLHAFYA